MRKINILFLGNSFTYFNDMYKTFRKICEANGIEVDVDQIAYGGYSLSHYIGKSRKAKKVNKKLALKHWDYVILQEHSRKPLDNLDEFLYSVIELNKLIVKNNGETVLYSTWSYLDNSSKLKETGLSYNEFYNVLNKGYLEASKLINCKVAPVGTIFKKLHKEIDLLIKDDFHPNITGSYIAALVLFKTIFMINNDKHLLDKITLKESELINSSI